MNKVQKEIARRQLEDEKKAIDKLDRCYQKALKTVEEKIRELAGRTDVQNAQSIAYQKKFQEALKAQLEGTLQELHSGVYKTLDDFLNESYKNGYIGCMYDIAKQGIPVVMPIDRSAITRAVYLDSKLSKPYYDMIGENVEHLKKAVTSEISRGLASGKTWLDMAEGIAEKGMKNSSFTKSINNAIRIARTEGHRISCASALDAMHGASSLGADVMKQWDSTLDGHTRESHQEADGQIVGIDEMFVVGGIECEAPGMTGDPAEDCNCRCAVLQRAKWALDADELETLKDRAEYFGLDKSESFEDFKKSYLNLPSNADTMKLKDVLNVPVKSSDAHYDALLTKLNEMKVGYNPVRNHTKQLSNEKNHQDSCRW